MRLFFRNLLWICALALIGGGVTACSDDETGPKTNPTLTAEGEATSWGTAEFTVLANDIIEYAWLVLPSEEAAPEEMIIFKDGETVTAPNAESVISVNGLTVLTDYTLYIAAKVVPTNNQMMEEFFGEVVSVPFKTLDYSDEFTVIKTTGDGFEAHLRYPELGEGKVIKWGIANIAMYNYQIQMGMMFGNGYSDADAINLNEASYPSVIVRNDTTFIVNNDNRYVRDANGEIVYDEWTNEANEYWMFIAPNEPLYMIMSEASWGESAWGWGEGYFSYPFDSNSFGNAIMDYAWGMTSEYPNQEDYWQEGAWHRRYEITTAAPKPYDGKVKIETFDLTTKSGVLTFTPDEEHMPFMYTITVMDDETYQQVLKDYLGGNSEHMQWFVTSLIASYTVGTNSLLGSYGPQQLYLEEYFYNLTPGGTYHAFAVAMDGDMIYDEDWGEEVPEADPTAQYFTSLSFKLPDYTLPAPELVVSPVESTDPYKVYFNIKCANYTSAPVTEASYVCNYVAEFTSMLSYLTYNDLLDYYGNALTADDLKEINSDAGLTLEFDSREDATSRLAIKGWNSEGRPSDPDAEGSKSWCDSKSAVQPDATPIASPYYESLQGNWTATATMKKRVVKDYSVYPYEYEWQDAGEVTSDVIIGNVTYPESMTDEVYQLYENQGVSKEEADAYFAQFKEQAELFNKKVSGQNRILCTGWGFDKHSYSAKYSPLRTATPWDLFTSSSYNASSVADIFYEFGPKWFLQVAEDGSLFVPVNVSRVPMATSWTGSNEHYLVGGNAEAGYALYIPLNTEDMNDVAKWHNIPVEVSEDNNTITLKTFEYDGVTYYPQIMYNDSYYGMSFVNSQVFSEVLLTRNASASTEAVNVAAVRQAVAAAPAQETVQAMSANGGKFIEKQINLKSRTVLAGKKPVKYQTLHMKALTDAQRKANMQKLYEKLQKSARK